MLKHPLSPGQVIQVLEDTREAASCAVHNVLFSSVCLRIGFAGFRLVLIGSFHLQPS